MHARQVSTHGYTSALPSFLRRKVRKRVLDRTGRGRFSTRSMGAEPNTSLTNQNCTNSMYSQGQKHFKPNGKQRETELQVGQGAFQDRHSSLGASHLSVPISGQGRACWLQTEEYSTLLRKPRFRLPDHSRVTLTPVKQICIIILCYIKASNSKGKKSKDPRQQKLNITD